MADPSGGTVSRWLAAGAPGAERDCLRGWAAFSSDLWGPVLSAVEVAELTSRSERGIRKLAEAARDHREPFSSEAPILLEGGSGRPLRHPENGACFGVVSAPASSTRGRPRSRSGETGYQFRLAGPWPELVAVPGWLEPDHHGPGIPLPLGLIESPRVKPGR